MSKNEQSSIIKSILEFGPIIIFFLAYRYAPIPPNFDGDPNLEQIIFATKLFIPVIFISLLLGWFQTNEIAKMPLFSAIIILIFGGLTIWLRDETFIKMKPTILYVLFSVILSFGLLNGKSYLKALMGNALPMNEIGWLIITRRFTVFFIFLALLNEVVWRLFSTDFWVSFKTFGLPILVLIFFFSQAGIIQKHSKKNENE
jgi:intracellular septation protein